MSENIKPVTMISEYFLKTSLKLNRGFIAIVETIPTIKKFNTNNPTNKYVLFTKLNKLNMSGINVNINKAIRLFDVLSSIFISLH